MDKFEELRDSAKKKLQVADHMLTMTYPMVQDPKLLMAVMENLFLALSGSIGALLHFERIYKRVPPFQDTFVSKFTVFRQKCAERYNIGHEYLMMIEEIKELIMQHKKSPVEFKRKNSFVICSESYNIQSISLEKMHSYISRSKVFVNMISDIIDEGMQLAEKELRVA